MVTDQNPMANLSGLQFLVNNLTKNLSETSNNNNPNSTPVVSSSSASKEPTIQTSSSALSSITSGNSPSQVLKNMETSNTEELKIDTNAPPAGGTAAATAMSGNAVNPFQNLDLLNLQKQLTNSNDPNNLAALLLRLKQQTESQASAQLSSTQNTSTPNPPLNTKNTSSFMQDTSSHSLANISGLNLSNLAVAAAVAAGQTNQLNHSQNSQNSASNILAQLQPSPPSSPLESGNSIGVAGGSNGNTNTRDSNNAEGWTFEEQFKQLYDLDTDYSRRKFLDDLFSFMQKRGTPVNRIPIMAKQVLDLYKLYKLVVEKGGLVEVINKKIWREITKGLNLPSSITSAAFTLRTQYMKYLYPFECEREGLSNPTELQAAIDGNRREGRRPTYGSPGFLGTNQSMVQNAAYLTAIAAASNGDHSQLIRLQQQALAAQQANNMQNAQKILLAQAQAAAQVQQQAQLQAMANNLAAQNLAAQQQAQKNVLPVVSNAEKVSPGANNAALVLEALQKQNMGAGNLFLGLEEILVKA